MAGKSELRQGFMLGDWEVLPDRGILRDGQREEHVEPLVMNVLLELAAADGGVVSKDDLILAVWDGRAQSDEPLLRAVSVLRRKLGDDSKNPRFVENIPRRGYRLMLPVVPATPPSSGRDGETSSDEATGLASRKLAILAAAAVIVVVAFVAVQFNREETPSSNDEPLQTLAIFPFRCAGSTEPYLCFGFSEELTATLLRLENLRIIKRTEPFPADLAPQQIARQVGADGILSGSVQHIGGQLRISAELIDGRNGFVVLSEPVDGPVEDLLRLQDEIAQRIAKSIFGGGRTVASASRPASYEAYQAYARGQYQFEFRSLEAIRAAIRLFEDTIVLDPGFGPAYLRLAFAYLLLPEYDSSLPEETMYARAAAEAEQGIAADPSIEDAAGTVFGFIHHKRGEWLEATRAFERAINAQTIYPVAHHWYSRFLATVGRMDEALLHARRANELDPASAVIISRLAITHFWLSDLEQAKIYFDIANEMKLDAPIHDLAYALYLIRNGDIGAARGYTRQGLEKYGFDASWVGPVFDGLDNPARRDAAIDIVSRLEAKGDLANYIIMTLWALLDEPDRAMATALSIEGIGQDFETGFEVLFSDELAELHAHPEFPILMEKTGLRAYWDMLGCDTSSIRVRCPDGDDRLARTGFNPRAAGAATSAWRVPTFPAVVSLQLPFPAGSSSAF